MTAAQSFEEISTRYSQALAEYLGRFVGDALLGEDLLQTTLLRISQGLETFEGRSSLKTWIYRVARHVAIDDLRSGRAGKRVLPIAEETAAQPISEPDRLVPDEMNACIRDEIASLPGDYRAALILHDLEGLTATETAAALECSSSTAKIRIHRARSRLGNALERGCTLYREEDDVLRCDRRARGRGEA